MLHAILRRLELTGRPTRNYSIPEDQKIWRFAFWRTTGQLLGFARRRRKRELHAPHRCGFHKCGRFRSQRYPSSEHRYRRRRGQRQGRCQPSDGSLLPRRYEPRSERFQVGGSEFKSGRLLLPRAAAELVRTCRSFVMLWCRTTLH